MILKKYTELTKNFKETLFKEKLEVQQRDIIKLKDDNGNFCAQNKEVVERHHKVNNELELAKQLIIELKILH